MTITMTWNERRLMWNENSDIPHWKWPTKIDISPSKLWLPVYFIHNCPTTDCVIVIDNYTEIDIFNNGSISLPVMKVIRSTCHLNLNLFPFDQQTCSIIFDMDNSIPFNFNTIMTNGYVRYDEQNDEWLVTSLSIGKEMAFIYSFAMNTSASDWTVTQEQVDNNTIVVYLTLVRTSSSDVYNLLAPVQYLR